MSNIYRNPQNYSIETIDNFIINYEIDKAVEAIIGLALYSDNRQDLQNFILNLLNSSKNTDIKNACIKALSHIVRIDGKIDEKVFDIINELKDNRLYLANIGDLTDDIEVYLKNRQNI